MSVNPSSPSIRKAFAIPIGTICTPLITRFAPMDGPPLHRLLCKRTRLLVCFWLSRFSECPLLAHSRHGLLHCTCPLSGVKRTWVGALHVSAYDPKRTSDRPLTRLVGTAIRCQLEARVRQ